MRTYARENVRGACEIGSTLVPDKLCARGARQRRWTCDIRAEIMNASTITADKKSWRTIGHLIMMNIFHQRLAEIFIEPKKVSSVPPSENRCCPRHCWQRRKNSHQRPGPHTCLFILRSGGYEVKLTRLALTRVCSCRALES